MLTSTILLLLLFLYYTASDQFDAGHNTLRHPLISEFDLEIYHVLQCATSYQALRVRRNVVMFSISDHALQQYQWQSTCIHALYFNIGSG